MKASINTEEGGKRKEEGGFGVGSDSATVIFSLKNI
jgi:hypothetical protein